MKRTAGFSVILMVFLAIAAFARDSQNKTRIPDFSSWPSKAYALDLDDDGKTDLTVKVYTPNEEKIATNYTMVQILLDRNNKERLLGITEYTADGTVTGRTYIRKEDEWLDTDDPANETVAMTEAQSFVNDMGGEENFTKIPRKLIEAMLRERK